MDRDETVLNAPLKNAFVATPQTDWTYHGQSKAGRWQFKNGSNRYFGVGRLVACNGCGEPVADDVPPAASAPDLCPGSERIEGILCRCAKSDKVYQFFGHLDCVQPRSPTETHSDSANGTLSEDLAVDVRLPEVVPVLTEPTSQVQIKKSVVQNKDATYLAAINRVAAQRAAGLDPDVRMDFMAQYLNESRANIYRKIKLSQFPVPVKRGRGAFWPMSSVEAYKAGKTQEVSHG